MATLKPVWKILADSFSGWNAIDAPRLGAALAYYTILSLAPLLVVVVGIAGLVFGRAAVEGQVIWQFQNTIGTSGADVVQTMGLLQAFNAIVSLVVTTILFALIYKVVPDVRITWRDVWIGAAVTAFLFELGKFLIGLYLGRAAVGSAYGAAGSLVVVLVWVYYSAQIFLLGAEFTHRFAETYGSRAPERHSMATEKVEPQPA